MPPRGVRRPDPAVVETALGSLKRALVEANLAARNGPRTPLRRPHAARVRLHHPGPAGGRRGGRPRPVPDPAGRGRLRRVRHRGREPEHVAAARAVVPRGGRPRPRRGHPDRPPPRAGPSQDRVREVAVPAGHRERPGPGARHRQEAGRRVRGVLRLRLDLHVPQRHRGLPDGGPGPLPRHRRRLSLPGGDAGDGHGVPREDGGGGGVARRADRHVRPDGSADGGADAVHAPRRPHRALGGRPRRAARGCAPPAARRSLPGLRRHEGLPGRGHRVPGR